jgi:RimJ/RimL family protein N-acetyltransferase
MINGEKVALRAVEKEDLALLRDWRNIVEFRRNFREVRELNMANQETWYAKVNSSPNDFMFTLVDAKTQEPIGACGLLYINWVIRSADFSFYIGKNNAYMDADGWAHEAAKLLLAYGFHNLNLNKIWMELYEFDHAKINFFTQQFHFQQDALLRDNCFEDGRYWNSLIISLLQKDFKTQP